jgi:hypothetical protein
MMLESSCGRNSSITPTPAVIASFEMKFGKDRDVRWKISDQSDYQAVFNQDQHPVVVYFNKNGNWLKTETELLSSELPAVILRTIVNAFKGNSIRKAYQVEKPDEGKTFRLILKSGRQLSTIDLTTDGVILNNNLP